ncbi:MAG: glycosyltransferase family 4 protein [Chrysiogenia bacterium]
MKTNSKILILGKLPPPFIGPAIATEIILKSKLSRHFELHFHSTKLNEDLNEFNKVSMSKFKRIISNYSKFRTMLTQVTPDITLVPIGQTNLSFIRDSLYILILKKHNKKHVLQLRGSNFKNWYHETSFIMKLWIKYILKQAAGVIVLGENLKEIFADFIDKNRIFVVPNGVDLEFPEKTSKNDKLRILYVGNLQPQKGIEDLIEALVLLKKNGKNVDCDIIGQWRDGRTKKVCVEKVKDNSLSVVFYGVKKGIDKNVMYSNADLFVFPPRQPEGHPWVIIEAMAAGLPIITTDSGAIRESVFENVNGFIVEKNNPQKISEIIELLINDEELRMKMAKESRRLYEEKFTEDRMVANLKKVFDQVLLS